ncbi:MAG TPA: TIGR04551 family protein [Myxococcales bacterium]|nr:TIGR04551 family protein [Myxococcales bacterium]
MRRIPALAAFCLLVPSAVVAQSSSAEESRGTTETQKSPANPSAGTAAQPSTLARAGESGTAAAPEKSSTTKTSAAGGSASESSAQGSTAGQTATPPSAAQIDQAEFRRQVMEEVRRELQKAKDEVKQQTSWVEQDSAARVQDSEAIESLRQRVNLFQPHGYFRLRGEFLYNLDLGRGPDPTDHTLFLGPYIGTGGNNSQSDANMRFRFEPTFEVSEDLAIYVQMDLLDNVLLGSDPVEDPFLDPFTPLHILGTSRANETIHLKRVWGRVNTQLGELLFGRMGWHWGLGILHNDGNCLDCDYGDTYDRIAFAPREIKGHTFTLMFDLLYKGAATTGEFGELGRSVDLDTLDDGYRLGLSITRVDTPEAVKRKLDAGQWVFNYGLLIDYRTQGWDTVTTTDVSNVTTLGQYFSLRGNVIKRDAKLYQPDIFLSLKKRKWRLDLEVASTLGNVGNRASRDVDIATNPQLTQSISFAQVGAALQTDLAFLSGDALLLGLEAGGASGDKGAFGFGARPWRAGSGNLQPTPPGVTPFRTAGPGDIDGNHLDFSDPDHTHGRVNNFVFNRAFNVDMILFRNLVTAVTSAWYLKPSLRYRPTGRKTGGGDDTGFEVFGSLIYSQAWYAENTPSSGHLSSASKPLGVELNLGVTYDTSDRFHAGLAYGLLFPLSGLRNTLPPPGQSGDVSIAHSIRTILAIPF